MMLQAPPTSRFLTPSMDEYVAKYERASSLYTASRFNLNCLRVTLTSRSLCRRDR